MSVYLYLTKKEWVPTWIEGGEIMIRKASHYVAAERSGIFTPDENVQREYVGDIFESNSNPFYRREGTKGSLQIDNCNYVGPSEFHGQSMFHIEEGGNNRISNLTVVMGNSNLPAKPVSINQRWEDALILCFSTKLCHNLQKRLNKEACVEITDLPRLKRELDDQLNLVSQFDLCKYTNKNKRNHFLKDKADSWQKECRLVWRIDGTKYEEVDFVNIKIPSGCAKEKSFR